MALNKVVVADTLYCYPAKLQHCVDITTTQKLTKRQLNGFHIPRSLKFDINVIFSSTAL